MINSRSGHDFFYRCFHPSFPFLVSSTVHFPCSIGCMHCSCSTSALSQFVRILRCCVTRRKFVEVDFFLQEIRHHRQSFFYRSFSCFKFPRRFSVSSCIRNNFWRAGFFPFEGRNLWRAGDPFHVLCPVTAHLLQVHVWKCRGCARTADMERLGGFV